MEFQAVCSYCGNTFVAKSHKAKYCSKKCKDILFRLKKGIACNPNTEPFHKVCDVCGKSFDTFWEQVKRCSPECSRQHHNQPNGPRVFSLQRVCQICGKPFFSTSTALTCGDPECVKELKRARDLRAYQKKREQQPVQLKPSVCVICGKPFERHLNSTQKTCSSECSKELKRKRKQKRHDKRIPRDRRIDNISLKRLYERDKGICYLCGGKCDWEDWRTSASGNKYPGDKYPTIEHVVPVSSGGLDSWDNVRLAHWKCNLEKGTTVSESQIVLEEFAKPILKSGAKKTAQYSLNGQLIKIWDSTSQIRKELGLNDKHIQNVCRKNKSNTGNAYGYHWEYVS